MRKRIMLVLSLVVLTSVFCSVQSSTDAVITPTPSLESTRIPTLTFTPTPELNTDFTVGVWQVCDFVDSLHIRVGAGIENDVLGYLSGGDVINVYDTNGSWGNISMFGDAWINMEYLCEF